MLQAPRLEAEQAVIVKALPNPYFFDIEPPVVRAKALIIRPMLKQKPMALP
jgi:hypothetical protein